MLDRVTGMQVFVRVAALGSFSAAARELDLSQTMVTKHVAALEERLGVKLLHRSTRRLTLTEGGRSYLAACERILAEIEEAEAEASLERIEPRGVLRLNVPLTFGFRHIAPAIPEFNRLHPAVSFDLGLADRYVDLIEEGWDLAIRIGRLKDSSLVARRLAPCRTVVCAAPSYLKEHGTPRSLEDLAGHNCLGYTLPSAIGANRWTFGLEGETVVPVQGNLRANNGDALLAAAVAGQGLIYQPTFIVGDSLRDGSLVRVLGSYPTYEPGIHAVLPSGRQAPAKVRAFVEFLARRFAPEPDWDRGL
ncbi:LysR family transcriptional regulator [Microvirga arsenatis]|uniref:LysR family transcriptional regulator n=1 Tax=Microvirga arsenatis TaxID=2692265 RepID=A0ABW9Z447_9HYPH|nr:LysR family transcriptional regulator [Microvirga arsenatis]NBJ12626.1 LysR family transcriptional regulator [Microvirga arsenatis]NBJ26485.1 LysR family transcriptional regulator [Microvirga arsenatis]